jgi:Flp pilus assembly pilin Flp
MKAQVITTEYTDLCPVQPWRQRPATEASQDPAIQGSAVPGAPAGTAAPRKASDRGASAVEWVIITGIVVAIVAGVGVIISNAISTKAKSACTQINDAGGNGGGNGGNTGTTGGTTGGNGCG